MANCDCRECAKLNFWEWLDGEPGLWATAITWTMAAVFIICLASYLF